MPTTTRSPGVTGDREAQRRERLIGLYQAEREGMIRLAHLLTGSVSTAEDLVQEAFLRVFDRVDAVDQPGAYLRRTVVNLANSHHRHRSVVDRWERRQVPPPDALPPDVDETWQALRGLPEAQRTVLVLRFYLDLKVDDIAAVLDIPTGTVKSQIHRGLAALSGEVTR
jgi:RNA polymerase sigma-70 factor (sigma-E family)